MSTLRYRGSREDLQRDLARLPLILAGKAPDPGGAVDALKLRMGLKLLSRIQEAYDLKSRGGTDAMGITWPPLAAATLALRRIGPMSMKRLKVKYRRMPEQLRAKVREQARRLGRLIFQQDRKAKRAALRILEKKRRTGTISWKQYQAAAKRIEGRLRDPAARRQALAGGFALILRDMGRMFQALTPVLGIPNQHLKTGPGWVEVGCGVDYFKYHQSDKPRKLKADGTPVLPRRQVLPDGVSQIPAQWLEEMGAELKKGIASPDFWRLFLGSKVA